MRYSVLLILFATLFFSCDWQPEEIIIDEAATVKKFNIAVGDTIIVDIQPEGSGFSEILNMDTNVVEIINHMNYDLGSQLILIGKGEGILDLSFSYNVLVAPDSSPLQAHYLIHLNVTEAIPLSVNVGEAYPLDFSDNLTSEQLNALDSVVAIVGPQNPQGAISLEQLSGEYTRFNLIGEMPGNVGLTIECYDSQGALIVALIYEIDIAIRKTVMAELFTNTGCVNCPQANHYLDNIKSEYGEAFALVRYHVNWTDPSDPMNLYNPMEVESRRAYYNIIAAPGFVLDGTLVTSLDEDDWSGRVSQASLDAVPVFISPIEVVESLDSLYLAFDLNTFGVELSHITVLSLVLEDSIHFSGSNGENLHMDVMRDMSTVSIDEINGLNSMQQSLKKPDDFGNAGPVNLLIFVQAEADKSVLQAREQQLY